MDMSDTGRPPAVPAPETANAAPAAEAAQERWHQLVSEMGAEIAVPLTAALERINALTSTGRIDKKGLRSLRTRLGLSAPQLALLLGVSEQSIYNWESKKATPRKEQLAAIIGMRGLGKREAQQRLDALKAPRRGQRRVAKKK